jgi:hypothetical protein
MYDPFHTGPIPEITGSLSEQWQALNPWAHRNNPTWRACYEEQRIRGLTETETLQLLACHLLRESEELRRRLMDLHLKAPAPIFTIKD